MRFLRHLITKTKYRTLQEGPHGCKMRHIRDSFMSFPNKTREDENTT